MTIATETEAARTAGAVIPFPVRPRAKVGLAPEQERLARALQSLSAALAEQHAALKAWRSALADLKASTASLDDSMQRYRTNLRSLGSSVSALRDKARSVEQWADDALAEDSDLRTRHS